MTFVMRKLVHYVQNKYIVISTPVGSSKAPFRGGGKPEYFKGSKTLSGAGINLKFDSLDKNSSAPSTRFKVHLRSSETIMWVAVSFIPLY